jgi:acyl carrier protein
VSRGPLAVLLAYLREQGWDQGLDDGELAKQSLSVLIDSLEMTELIAFVEDHFAIEMAEDAISPETFGSAISLAEFLESADRRK